MDELRRKTCIKCGENKYTFEFNISRKNLDGLTGSCKDCIKKAYQDRNRKNDPPKSKYYVYPPL